MRKSIHYVAGAAVAGLLISASLQADAKGTVKPAVTDVPATTYSLDKAHASLIFEVSHLGFSNWTGRFASWDAKLTLDPKNPANSSVEATIDPNSLTHDNPPAGFLDQLHGPQFLSALQFPNITFKSTKIVMTAPDKALVTGDFTLHGITKQVTLDTTFNGGWAKMPMDPGGARVGFSAHGSLNRSDFGIGMGVPPKGSKMGVGDLVNFQIEAEFSEHPAPEAKQ
ncbi:MAG TPA: YceI family protein [Rhizomicrobium sp.]|jgi:polyisoprenoid-binding protein YceI